MTAPLPSVKSLTLTSQMVKEAMKESESDSRLNLKGRQITQIDGSAFTDCSHITHMDLQDNKLTSVGPEFRSLKKLIFCDLRNNMLRHPLNFMKYLSRLEEVSLDGNQIRSGDKLVVLYFCPKLKCMDGRQVSKMRATLNDIVQKINSKLESVWLNEKGDEQLSSTSRSERLAKDCLRRMKKDFTIPEPYTMAAEVIMDDIIRRKVSDEAERLRQSSIRKQGLQQNGSAVKRPAPAVHSPSKKIASEPYEAKVFIRCHSHEKDPRDSSTQVWKASFKPVPDGESEQLVATCGGNLLCVIDCEDGKVVSRYADTEPHENFYSVAWTTVEGPSGQPEDILAVGGNCCKIVIIRYSVFRRSSMTPKAHGSDINSLLFHPTRRNWLFSGAYDKKIKLWNLVVDADGERSLQPLHEIDINNKILVLAFSEKFDTLFVGGEEGMTTWRNVSDYKSTDGFGQFKFGRKTEAIIDGLSILPDKPHLLALKHSRSGRIDICKIADLIAKVRKANVRSRLNSFREVEFTCPLSYEYSKTHSDYFGLHAASGLIGCGDDQARICLYNTCKLSGDETGLLPIDDVISWPEIENPKHNNRKVVDMTKDVLINSLVISNDSKFIVAVTNINLVCIWCRKHLSDP